MIQQMSSALVSRASMALCLMFMILSDEGSATATSTVQGDSVYGHEKPKSLI
jgi:hypothetical protein